MKNAEKEREKNGREAMMISHSTCLFSSRTGQRLDVTLTMQRTKSIVAVSCTLILTVRSSEMFENCYQSRCVAIWSTIQFSSDSMEREITKNLTSFSYELFFSTSLALIFDQLWFLNKEQKKKSQSVLFSFFFKFVEFIRIDRGAFDWI